MALATHPYLQSDDYFGIEESLMVSTIKTDDPNAKTYHEFSTKDPEEFERYFLRKLEENREKQDELEREATAEMLKDSLIIAQMHEDVSDDENISPEQNQ